MDSKAEMLMKRALSEIDSAAILFDASGKTCSLEDVGIRSPNNTFYSGVISHAYYAIFYSAKAMLASKNIDTKAPEIHKKTFDAFKETFIDSGLLDVKLLMIYKQMIVRAETLLEIYKEEKGKRGNFTYNTIAQANITPAKESIGHAKMFFRHCDAYLGESD